ncbi:MAG: inositol monophosphatase [Anaerolineae bacterium]|nr:MAG: inositol monophosphatase [Anaerolineae bacterium]
MNMNMPQLTDLEQMARQAGRILAAHYEKETQVTYKGVIDLVTEVDRASEAFLLGEVQRLFPAHNILAEESGLTSNGDTEHLWLIDPLDGTVNYAHGIPIFSVSVAYAYRGQVRLAAVYDPMRDEMYTAERGQGAYLNGTRRLHVSSQTELAKSLLVTGFPYDAWNAERDNFANFVRLSRQTQGVRRLGSAAIDLCYVAAGRFDGFWEISLKPWDVAAGGLIAEEAGAVVTNLLGEPDYLSPPQSVVTANPLLHVKLLAALQEKDQK